MNQALDLREFAAALCCRCSRPVLDPSLEQAARGFHQKREELGDVHPFMRWIGSEWEADLDLSAATASVSKWWGGGGNEKVVVDEETRRKLREVFDKVHTGGAPTRRLLSRSSPLLPAVAAPHSPHALSSLTSPTCERPFVWEV